MSTTSPSTRASVDLELAIRPRTTARVLIAAVCVLVVFGAIANVVIYHVAPHEQHGLARLMARFDLGQEPSIPSWYSSLLLLASSLLLLLIGHSRSRSDPNKPYWCGLAFVFLILAIDEAVMFHELVDTAMHNWLGLGGVFYFAWVIPGALFVSCFGLLFLRFLSRLAPRTRWLFIASGAIFVAGAIGMELVAGLIFERAGSPEAAVRSLAHTASQTVEEFFEMLGVTLFIYALLDFISREIGSIRITIGDRASPRRSSTITAQVDLAAK